MGKAVPKGIKTKAATIMKEMPEGVSESFEGNKTTINSLVLPIGKWTRNVMAGFMARKTKQKKLAEKRKEELRAKMIARNNPTYTAPAARAE
jgi:ribosomal protein S17E